MYKENLITYSIIMFKNMAKQHVQFKSKNLTVFSSVDKSRKNRIKERESLS